MLSPWSSLSTLISIDNQCTVHNVNLKTGSNGWSGQYGRTAVYTGDGSPLVRRPGGVVQKIFGSGENILISFINNVISGVGTKLQIGFLQMTIFRLGGLSSTFCVPSFTKGP